MVNIRIHYLVYPLVFGLLFGWFFTAILKSLNVNVKPFPTAKVAASEKIVPPAKLAEDAIVKNIFKLELKPAPTVAADGNPLNGEVLAAGSSGGVLSGTPFNGKLLGLLRDTSGKNGLAIINDGTDTFSLWIGSEKNGVKLVELGDSSATVEHNRQKYKLTLEINAALKQVVTAQPQPQAKAKAQNQPVQTGSNINISLKRDGIQAELKDLNKILQSALVSPSYAGTEFQGYRVTRMREDSPLVKLGLIQGDIITRVNGSDLKSPEILFNMLSQIDDITAISLDMIRNNEKKTIFVEIQ